MYSQYDIKDRFLNEVRSQSPKADFSRSSLKYREDLSFLKHLLERENRIKIRETIDKPDYSLFVPKSSKADDRGSLAYFKSNPDHRIIDKNCQPEDHKNRDKKNNSVIGQNYQTSSQTNVRKKQETENMRPNSNASIENIGNIEYKKLHDKLNYLENKITEMRSNFERKREEKKRYFEKETKEKEKIVGSEYKSPIAKEQKTDPLMSVVSQVTYKKNLKPVSFDPYSPRHNTYYVSEIVRAYKEENSLARDHLISSIQLLKKLRRSRIPSNEEMAGRAVKFVKKPIHQDETLIHCNSNVNSPCDVKLPIRFPTGELIYAGINIRPYAVELLKELSKNFEIIVFTASHSCYANVVLNYLDPEGKYISYRLFREHCYYSSEGFHVKDLRVINRDLSQTILVDNAAYSYAYQIDNGVPIIPYYEGKVDFELKALQTYLESMILCKDVREMNKSTFSLHKYWEFDNPELLVQELYHRELR